MDNIRSLGAVGDGITDDFAAFQKAVTTHHELYIPDGTYLLSDTWRLPSHLHIVAEPGARIVRKLHTQTGRRDFLLCNADTETGNCDISITGGIWDGNCMVEDRGTDLFDTTATTGVLLNFRGVRNLRLSGMTLRNPLCYYMRFCQAQNVTIEDIRFHSDRIIPNQDGIHFAGFCKDFIIRNLWGNEGSPNDDFLAFNADDALFRQESFDVINGPIENITAEHIHSHKCHCFVRLLSVDSPIRNVTVRHVSGECKGVAVCMDAARYCRVPLFRDEDKPNGVGHIENVVIEDMAVCHKDDPEAPFINLETNCPSFTVKQFRNTGDKGLFACIRKICPHGYSLNGIIHSVSLGENIRIAEDSVDTFTFKKEQAT